MDLAPSGNEAKFSSDSDTKPNTRDKHVYINQ